MTHSNSPNQNSKPDRENVARAETTKGQLLVLESVEDTAELRKSYTLDDGIIVKHDAVTGYHFNFRYHTYPDVGLLNLLRDLNLSPGFVVNRWAPIEAATSGFLGRKLSHPHPKGDPATLMDLAAWWYCIDLDDVDIPPGTDPVARPEECVRAVIEEHLPERAGVSVVVQWSNSMSLVSGNHIKAHLWYELDHAVTNAELRRWAAVQGPAVDRTLYHSAQHHYTAGPSLGAGIEDPYPGDTRVFRIDWDREEDHLEIPSIPLVVQLDKACGTIQHAGSPRRGKEVQDALYALGQRIGAGELTRVAVEALLRVAVAKTKVPADTASQIICEALDTGELDPASTPLDAPTSAGRADMTQRHRGSGRGYMKAVLVNECERVRTTPQGGRTIQLFKSACALGRFVGGGELDRDLTEAMLLEAAEAAGMAPNRIEGSLSDGLAAGELEPRTAPPGAGVRARHYQKNRNQIRG